MQVSAKENAQMSGKKVEPGPFFAAIQCHLARSCVVQSNMCKQTFLEGFGVTLMLYYCLLVSHCDKKLMIVPVITFQSGKILCEYYKLLCSVLASDEPKHWLYYSNWTSWIKFHHLTSALKNMPPPTQPLSFFLIQGCFQSEHPFLVPLKSLTVMCTDTLYS